MIGTEYQRREEQGDPLRFADSLQTTSADTGKSGLLFCVSWRKKGRQDHDDWILRWPPHFDCRDSADSNGDQYCYDRTNRANSEAYLLGDRRKREACKQDCRIVRVQGSGGDTSHILNESKHDNDHEER